MSDCSATTSGVQLLRWNSTMEFRGQEFVCILPSLIGNHACMYTVVSCRRNVFLPTLVLLASNPQSTVVQRNKTSSSGGQRELQTVCIMMSKDKSKPAGRGGSSETNLKCCDYSTSLYMQAHMVFPT